MELATAEWVDWYNHRRLHSAIGHLPPTAYETAFYAPTTPARPLEQPLKPPQTRGDSIFAVARTAGWIAHALEAYESGMPLRPRAVTPGPLLA